MKLVMEDSKMLKDSIGIVSGLIVETKVNITKDGVSLVAMDAANVAMVVYTILPSAFTEYKVDKDETLGLRLNDLHQIFRRSDAKDRVTLDTIDGQLRVILTGKQKRTFSIRLIDISDSDRQVPELKYTTKITVPAEVLSDAVDDASIVAESVTFTVAQNKVTASAIGDLSTATVEISASDEVKIETDGKAKSKFAIEYLKKMTTGEKLSENLILSLGTDYPLTLEYRQVDRCSLKFILAPRVETE